MFENLSTSALHERKRILCQIKHTASPERRIGHIETEIGQIKKELKRRQKERK